MSDGQRAGVMVTLDEIYKQVRDTDDKVDKLAAAVGNMVAINRRLDQHHDRLNDHGARLGSVETAQAIITATTRRPTPWYLVVGSIVGIITGVAGLLGVLAYLSQISTALAG